MLDCRLASLFDIRLIVSGRKLPVSFSASYWIRVKHLLVSAAVQLKRAESP